jgi:hypothetical protein
LLKSSLKSGALRAFNAGLGPLEFGALLVERTVGSLILYFLGGVVAVGIAGAVYTVSRAPAGYRDDHDPR